MELISKLNSSIPAPKNRVGKHLKIDKENIERHLQYFIKMQKDFFTFDNDNIEIITELIKYFNGNTCKYDLNKGICLFGDYGVGKSYIFKAVKNYVNGTASITKNRNINSYRIASIEELMSNIGVDNLDSYLRYKELSEWKYINLCIDEFGSELESKMMHYGTPIKEHIERFIMRRYEDFAGRKSITHATTNLRPEDLQKYYGNRLTDRFVEMFNFVEVKGKSRRK